MPGDEFVTVGHDEQATGSIGSAAKQGCCPSGDEIDLPRGAQRRTTEDLFGSVT